MSEISRPKKFYNRRNFNRKPFHKNDKSRNKVIRAQAEQLSEKDVGITEYVTDVPGFSGVIKARFSDFHVNEIDSEGKIAKLTDTKHPESFHVSKSSTDESKHEISIDLILQDISNKIKSLSESDEKTEDTVEIPVSEMSKEDRARVYNEIKKAFGQKVVANTISKGEEKFIQIKKYNKNIPKDTRTSWPVDTGEYVHFLVFKENMDTLEACYQIGDCLRISSSSFSYAGVKDRRAKTTQWFSARRVEPWKLLKNTRSLRNVKVGNICFKNQPLKLGQLKGNRFRIALRNVTADDQQIDRSLETLKDNGFVNYYGLQRFGNDKDAPTYLIGEKLMLGKWKEACDLILLLKTSDDPASDITKAKQVYHGTLDAKKAVECFNNNKNKCVEYKLLEGLSKNGPNDYVNSFENIPRNSRLLYIHAFQSLIWNKVTSKRLKDFGMKPIVGDIVLLNDKKTKNTSSNPTSDTETINPTPDDAEYTEEKCSREIKFLTEEDLDKYTIFDVVLPLPGYDIEYPRNEVKDWYKEELEKVGLTLEMPKQRVKTYTLSGDYRNVLSKVENLSWYTLKYNNPNCTLIRSDFEEILGHKEPESVPDGAFKALIIDFCLNSSNYATMVLREILKIDTATSAHCKMNNYYEKTNKKDTKETEAIQIASDSTEKYTEVEPVKTNSLLNNPDKFKAFEDLIFNSNESVKRKAEDDDENGSKKPRNDSENEETNTIKLQASLAS